MDYGKAVRFGVFITPVAQPEHSLAVAVKADELGFDLIGLQDHQYQSRFLDGWTLLTAMAMRTKRIQVFLDVAKVPLRPPAILAKAAASLDLLTGAVQAYIFAVLAMVFIAGAVSEEGQPAPDTSSQRTPP